MKKKPNIDAVSQHQTTELQAFLQSKITKQGPITFAEFMENALYHPQYGYYCTQQLQIGKQGDFATAAEISPLFSYCLARQCGTILTTLPQKNILEFGAGNGKMAAAILTFLKQHLQLEPEYFIVERSPYLIAKQQQFFKQNYPQLLERMHWQAQVPENFVGVMLANEVLDAMPCHLFQIQQAQLYERYVTFADNKFTWLLDVPSEKLLLERITEIQRQFLSHIDDYQSEVNLNYESFLQQIATRAQQTVLLCIDYGYAAQQYYHPQRNMGTLKCIYRHKSHADPLIYPGLQDISAHVDFTALTNAAKKYNFACLGYTNQAAFLINCGLTDIISQSSNDNVLLAAQAKLLTLPNEMGEIVKVIGLAKDYDLELIGFSAYDKQQQL
ncbi:MAG: SAM-dependent methyltransferase [Pseudomonadota bacterium]